MDKDGACKLKKLHKNEVCEFFADLSLLKSGIMNREAIKVPLFRQTETANFFAVSLLL